MSSIKNEYYETFTNLKKYMHNPNQIKGSLNAESTGEFLTYPNRLT